MNLFNLRFRKAGASKKGVSDYGDLTGVSPVKLSGAKLIRNKAGRAVFSAVYRGRKIKAYQAFSEEHAGFITALTRRLPAQFPEILCVRGAWVFAEWVEGSKPSPGEHAYAVDALRQLHQLRPGDLPAAGFNYLGDYIIPRFLEAATLGGYSHIGDPAVAEVRAFWKPDHVIHADLTPDNVIVTKDGPVVIDNELLGLGNSPLLDVCNAVRPLDAQSRTDFLKLWLSYHDITDDELRVTSLIWLMREAGTAFVSGRLDRCRDAIQAIEADPQEYLPFGKIGH